MLHKNSCRVEVALHGSMDADTSNSKRSLHYCSPLSYHCLILCKDTELLEGLLFLNQLRTQSHLGMLPGIPCQATFFHSHFVSGWLLNI